MSKIINITPSVDTFIYSDDGGKTSKWIYDLVIEIGDGCQAVLEKDVDKSNGMLDYYKLVIKCKES